MQRTHTCGQLRREDAGSRVTLAGWVNRRRDHGNVVFIDLRDRWGTTQVVFDADLSAGSHDIANALRIEYVVQVV